MNALNSKAPRKQPAVSNSLDSPLPVVLPQTPPGSTSGTPPGSVALQSAFGNAAVTRSMQESALGKQAGVPSLTTRPPAGLPLAAGSYTEEPATLASAPLAASSAASDATDGEKKKAAPAGASPSTAERTGLSGGEGGGPVPSVEIRMAAGGAPTVPTPMPEVDTTSTEGLLASLLVVPASLFPKILADVKAAAPPALAKEKADLESDFPRIQRPTGLPRRAERKTSPSQLPVSIVPALPSRADSLPGQPGQQSESDPGLALPENGPTASAEPVSEETNGGNWWDWLIDSVSRIVGGLPVSDPGLSTSAGPAPPVDLTGTADPAQTDQYQQECSLVIAEQGMDAEAATNADFGEHDIYPTVPDETLRPAYKPTAPPAVPAAALPGKPIPVGGGEAIDANMTAEISGKVNEGLSTYRKHQTAYSEESETIRSEGDLRIAQDSDAVRVEQEGLQREARVEVTAAREQWRGENLGIEADFAAQSGTARSDINQQITTQVETAGTQSEQVLTRAEEQAEKKRVAEEGRAAAEKRKAENQPRSWWQRFKGAVVSAINAIRKVVNDIIDGLRKAVKAIIAGAKAIVHGIIEAARTVIVGLIKAFGETIKGFVSIALAAFPKAAARARAWIDEKVNHAVQSVNEVADALALAADAVLDWVGAGLDAALTVVQLAFNLTLDVFENACKLVFGAIDLLAQLGELLANIVPLVRRISALIDDPTPVIDAIKAYIGSLIPGIEPLASAGALAAITFSPPPKNHWAGIWAHLHPKLSYLYSNWWEVVKTTSWTLLWPFAKDAKSGERPLFKDCEEIWRLCSAQIPKDIFSGRFSKAADGILRVQQLGASVVGMFYGWIFIGLVVGGGILGAEVGVLPGMAAGAALALEIGQGLLVATVITEGEIVAKSGYNLVFQKQTPQENDQDYERIAGSSLMLAIMGVLYLLGAVAARFGKAILSAAGKAVSAIVEVALGPRAAALLKSAFARIRAEVLAIVERFRKEGKFKLRNSGIGKGTYEGPASALHPERLAEILADLERAEVRVNPLDTGDPWTGSYSPGRKGEPGSMRVHKDVDIRTLEHEYQHFLDDRARGYPGLAYYIQNPAEMFEMERIAYNREMDLVRADPALSAEEQAAIVKELEAALEQERIRYLTPSE